MIIRNGSMVGKLNITIILVIVTDIVFYITFCVNYGLNIEVYVDGRISHIIFVSN